MMESYKGSKAVENIKRKQVENGSKVKETILKKKDGDKKSPLLDFDFEGQMKSFMGKS